MLVRADWLKVGCGRKWMLSEYGEENPTRTGDEDQNGYSRVSWMYTLIHILDLITCF
jgi:hypothetical protein